MSMILSPRPLFPASPFQPDLGFGNGFLKDNIKSIDNKRKYRKIGLYQNEKFVCIKRHYQMTPGKMAEKEAPGIHLFTYTTIVVAETVG